MITLNFYQQRQKTEKDWSLFNKWFIYYNKKPGQIKYWIKITKDYFSDIHLWDYNISLNLLRFVIKRIFTWKCIILWSWYRRKKYSTNDKVKNQYILP